LKAIFKIVSGICQIQNKIEVFAVAQINHAKTNKKTVYFIIRFS